MTLEKKIKLALIIAGMTQLSLAAQLGISRGYLREMLRGTRPLLRKYRDQLCIILNLEPQIFDGVVK